jgi:hypothetical protein
MGFEILEFEGVWNREYLIRRMGEVYPAFFEPNHSFSAGLEGMC